MKSEPATAASTDQAPAATLVWGLSRREAAILAAIVAATIAVYLPSLRNGWVFDDWGEIVNNKLIHSWSFVWKSFIHDSSWFINPARLPQSAYYRPLQNAWFGLNYLMLGNRPAAWHLEKLALHLVAVMLSFRLAQLLSGSVAVALMAAAIFGLMPANVEAVVWVSAIPEPLSAVFELGALLCLVRRRPGWSRAMGSAIALYACALLTHETAILFPVIVAAYVFLIEGAADKQIPRSSRNPASIRTRAAAAARVAAPFALLAVVYLCVRIEVLGLSTAFSWPHRPVSGLEAMWRAAKTAKPQHGLVPYMLTVPVVLLTYLGVLAVPGMAGPAHAVDWITRASAITFVSAGVLLILAAGAWVLVRPSSDRRLYLFCAAWSILALAPALSLSSLWSLVGDRYLYAASFGWSLALALAAVRLAAASPRARTVVGAAIALLLAGYMVTASRIEHYWHDDLAFFGQCVAADPAHLGCRRMLGDAMEKAGDLEGAARALELMATLDPGDAYVHLKLSQLYMKIRRVPDFEREFRKFIELSGQATPSSSVAPGSSASQPAAAP